MPESQSSKPDGAASELTVTNVDIEEDKIEEYREKLKQQYFEQFKIPARVYLSYVKI